MQYVRALVEDQWREVPITIARPAEPDPLAPEPPKLVRTVVMALEDGLWKVNSNEYGVTVFPGLVVSFNDVHDANFFLASPARAQRLQVTPGQIVQFHDEADAEHFIALGQAERVHRRDAQKALAAQTEQSAGAPEKIVAMRAARQA
jgi:hypothetical protein